MKDTFVVNLFSRPLSVVEEAGILWIREQFQLSLARTETLSWDYLQGMIDRQLQFASLPLEKKSNLYQIMQEWYLNISQMIFLLPLIFNSKIREILLHDSAHMQLDIEGETGLSTIKLSGFDEVDFKLAVESLAYRERVTYNYTNPFASFTLNWSDNDSDRFQRLRATVIHPSITPHQRTKLFLRKLDALPHSYEQFALNQSMQAKILNFLDKKKNIVIAGAGGSGKTTLLRRLLDDITDQEHLVVMEDAYELVLARGPVTHLLGHEGTQHKSLRDYCSYALRLRPDRIILGEIRGAEIIPFFLAMNTGHRGMLCTVHANSAEEVVERLALLYVLYSEHKAIDYIKVEEMIRRNVEVVIYLKNKKVVEILTN